MPATSYEQLDAWKRGMDLVCEVYRVTRLLPTEERFGLISQLRRAAVSIPSNIAEGSGRQGRRELLYHLSVARGSLKELETLLAVLERLGYVVPAKLADSKDLCGHVSRLTFGMRRK
ncbi:MAG: four helix bundle protein, partial [Gemmatimonadaceae bacterium]